MSTEPWPEGAGRRVFDTIDSTLDEAARIAPDLAGPEWILAHEQTAGRGRRGRPWASQKGNFAATLVMRPEDPPEALALRSFVASLALYDALVAVTGRPEILSLKWPNDVLLNGGKVAGILLETASAGAGARHLFIGIGVNLQTAPGADEVGPGATPPVALARETGAQVSPEAFLDHLAPAFATWEHRLTTYGFAPIREAWLARAAKLGEVITARLPGEEVAGRFQTVDEGGNLVLQTANGRRVIPAADIYF